MQILYVDVLIFLYTLFKLLHKITDFYSQT